MGVWSKKGRKENRDREAEWTLRKNRMPSTTNGNSLLELGNFHFHFHCKCILHGVAIYERIWTVYQHIYVCVCVCLHVCMSDWVSAKHQTRQTQFHKFYDLHFRRNFRCCKTWILHRSELNFVLVFNSDEPNLWVNCKIFITPCHIR